MNERVLTSDSVDGTRAIGRQLGQALTCGQVVALVGPLGAGKTTLVKGLAEGANVLRPREVNSPTFVLINEYETEPQRGGLRLFHVDAYRLHGGDDLDALGFDELCTEGAVLIEWADRVEDILPDDVLTIRLEPVGDIQRRLTCFATGAQSQQLLACLGE